MGVIYLMGCIIVLRLGTRIHCATAAVIVLVALGVRFLPGLMEESPPEPPPGAPLQNTGSERRPDENQALLIVLGALLLIGVLFAVVSKVD
ncbi:hypothetical protein [Archangium lansingense]|uniref:MYXO-CTERM domain-containing protein n=1 Tax=Archangium lansingense TaxID=2995310 RepID=A0ABT4AMB4_9BACT|nr:hypothetical protein [Archangium lansinium]MCY1082820.1 hypothetical protein [Archangium lansinium]